MPIYFSWFITALLSVSGDPNHHNLPQSGRLFILRVMACGCHKGLVVLPFREKRPLTIRRQKYSSRQKNVELELTCLRIYSILALFRLGHAMPYMILYYHSGLLVKFRCTDCDWSYSVSKIRVQPLPLAASAKAHCQIYLPTGFRGSNHS
jgi:hypothetical protein